MRRKAALLSSAALLAGLLLAACSTEIAADTALPNAISVSVQEIPLSTQDPAEKKVGRLVYRGGLAITSTDKRFGGWSGLKLSADGVHLLSQSDESHWLKADLVYDKSGKLTGIRNAQLADMQDLTGKIMTGKEGDAEGLALLSNRLDGPVAVSFERNHRIWEYDLAHGLDAKPTEIASADEIKKLGFNIGLESLVRLRPNTLLAIAEAPQLDANGDIPAWLIPAPGTSGGTEGRLSVKPHAPYEISDGTMSPDGKHLYLLERHFFDPVRGIVIAVREIDAATIKPGARLEGEEIASFTVRENIDNMEGIALHRGPHGETRVTIMADDNYNPVERTLLLQFELQ